MATWEAPGVDPSNDHADDEVVWARLRARRNAELIASDWTQIQDATVDKAVWANYRQALRDLPSTVLDPRLAVWPEPPGA